VNNIFISLSIDTFLSRTTRSGGGPVEEGITDSITRPCFGLAEECINAERYNNLIQRAFFDGFKTCQGKKNQIVELLNGELYRPKYFR
jgi:hypothetical protein